MVGSSRKIWSRSPGPIFAAQPAALTCFVNRIKSSDIRFSYIAIGDMQLIILIFMTIYRKYPNISRRFGLPIGLGFTFCGNVSSAKPYHWSFLGFMEDNFCKLLIIGGFYFS